MTDLDSSAYDRWLTTEPDFAPAYDWGTAYEPGDEDGEDDLPADLSDAPGPVVVEEGDELDIPY